MCAVSTPTLGLYVQSVALGGANQKRNNVRFLPVTVTCSISTVGHSGRVWYCGHFKVKHTFMIRVWS